MNRLRRVGFLFLAIIPVLAATPRSATAQIQIFSTGQYGTPETISLAPPGFGSFGGSYFIPDAETSNIWVVPSTGGPPAAFLAAPIEPVGNSIIGGLFLPSGWGAYSGKLLVAAGSMLTIDSAGTVTPLDPLEGAFSIPLIAPALGPYVGNLFVTDQNGFIWRAAPSGGGLTSFADLHGAFVGGPFGIELTPSGFGSFGNRLMVSDALGGSIVAVDANGTWGPFTTVPLETGQIGLRQLLMAPDNYFFESLGIPGQLLLVSVSGSKFGGGVLGELLALDSLGNVAAHLITGSVTNKFDPRGMILTADNHILISDTSDPIWKASASDFAPGRGAVCSVISSVSTSSLWPPNHNLVNVGLKASSSCLAEVSIAVYSNEDDTADTGDGNFSPDAKGTTPAALRLRAERNGKGNGRVYLIVVESTDSAGTVAPSCNTVTVPLSQSKDDKAAVDGRAAAAQTFCRQNTGTAPSGFFVVGDGPVIGPKQ